MRRFAGFRRFTLAAQVSAAAALASAAALLAAPLQVADLDPYVQTGTGSDPQPLATIGGRFFFWGSDPATGREPWISDGTPEGTGILADLCPGRCSASLSWRDEAVVVGETLFFTACDGSRACQLWKSDGTASGTGLVEAFGPSNSRYLAYQVEDLTAWNGEVYFAAADPLVGWELFRSDGSPEGTVLVKDFRPGVADTGFLRLVPAGKRLYVSSTAGLWVTDGTEAGTELLLELPEGSYLGTSQTTLGERLIFTVRRRSTGLQNELWVSDGTPGGTALLRTADFRIDEVLTVGDRAFFFESMNGGSLWTTDGSVSGTVLVSAEVPHGVERVAVFDGALYFADGIGLWRSDGTPAGTGTTFRASGTITELVVADGVLYFLTTSADVGVWRTLGSAETTEPVLRGEPGRLARAFVFGDRLALSVERVPKGEELAVLEPASGDLTFLTATFDPGSGDPRDLVAGGSRLLFVSGTDVWAAAAPGPRRPAAELVAPFSSPVRLVAPAASANPNRGVYAFADDLWLVRDSNALVRLAAGGGDRRLRAHPHAFVGETLYFLVRDTWRDAYELWVTDGTPLGTGLVSAGLPSNYFCWDPPCTPISLEMAALDGKVFVAHQTKVWRFDPADSSLAPIFDSDDLDGCSDEFCQVEDLAVAGERLFFTSVGNVQPRVLWSSDGTAGGTVPVLELDSDDYFFSEPHGIPAGTLAPVRELTPFDGKLYFVARHPELGDELWVSNGSAEGTRVVRDVRRGRLSSFPTALTVYDGRLVFAADDGIHGQELWVSDGSAEGTALFADLRDGRASSFPQQLAIVDGVLVFAADDGAGGLEPWRTDLTDPGTRRLADVRPGPISSSPRDFTAAGRFVYFNAAGGIGGFELFAVPRAELHKPSDGIVEALEEARRGTP